MPEMRETTLDPVDERRLAEREQGTPIDTEERRFEDEEDERGERLDFQTLALAALASAAAALITSRIWSQGAIVSAAMTPVIVALVKEGLRKPTERVSAVGSRVASASKSSLAVVTPRTGGRAAPPAPGDWEPAASRAAPNGRVGAPDGEPAPGPGARRDHALARLRVFRSRRLHVRMALITGLLAFLIAVFALTVPELIVGDSVGSGGGTTLFGGGEGDGSDASRDPEGGEPSAPPAGESPAPDQEPQAAPTEAPPPEEEPPAEEPPSESVEPQVAPPSGAPSG